MPVASRITTVQAVADRNRRTASEETRAAGWALSDIARRGEEITKPAHRLDDVDAELLADAADEHLDRVGVAVEVLIVEVLHQFGARHHPSGVMHQIGEQAILVRRELDRRAVHGDAARA